MPDRPEKQLSSGCAAAIGLAFFTVGAGFTGAGVAQIGGLIDSGGPTWMLLVLGVPFLVLGGLVALASALRGMAERRLGKVELRVEPRKARPGGAIEVAVSFTPRADVELLGATATLEGRSSRTVGGKNASVSKIETVHEGELELLGPGPLEADRDVECAGTLALPDDAPATSKHGRDRMRWVVEVRLRVGRCPDWYESVPIEVAE